MRHLAGAFIRPWRAFERRFRHGEGIHTTVGHGFKLLAQRRGFRARFPRLQNLTTGVGRLQAFDAVEMHVHTGRNNEFVVADGAAIFQAHGFLGWVDGGDKVVHQTHAMLAAQSRVGRGDLRHGFAATQDQVGHGA